MFKPCILVPVYDHAGAIGSVVEQLRPFGLHCWLIDDGSNAHCQATLKEIAAREASWLSLLRLEQNSGKGAAMMLGFGAATKAGYSHGLQVDADGQHDTRSIRELLDNARAHPKALVTGIPIYGDDVPKARLYGLEHRLAPQQPAAGVIMLGAAVSEFGGVGFRPVMQQQRDLLVGP